jgi:hypothetical protein
VCSAELNQAKKAQTAEKILNAEKRTRRLKLTVAICFPDRYRVERKTNIRRVLLDRYLSNPLPGH